MRRGRAAKGAGSRNQPQCGHRLESTGGWGLSWLLRRLGTELAAQEADIQWNFAPL